MAAATGGGHSIFATVTLGLLALGMGHSLLDEIRRQATRGPAGGWATADTANTTLLIGWAVVALAMTVLHSDSLRLGGVGAGLTVGYAAVAASFVRLRRRTVRAGRPGTATAALATDRPPGHTTTIVGTGTPADRGSAASSGT